MPPHAWTRVSRRGQAITVRLSCLVSAPQRAIHRHGRAEQHQKPLKSDYAHFPSATLRIPPFPAHATEHSSEALEKLSAWTVRFEPSMHAQQYSVPPWAIAVPVRNRKTPPITSATNIKTNSALLMAE
jgi:hypothetical protein